MAQSYLYGAAECAGFSNSSISYSSVPFDDKRKEVGRTGANFVVCKHVVLCEHVVLREYVVLCEHVVVWMHVVCKHAVVCKHVVICKPLVLGSFHNNRNNNNKLCDRLSPREGACPRSIHVSVCLGVQALPDVSSARCPATTAGPSPGESPQEATGQEAASEGEEAEGVGGENSGGG